MRDADFTDSSVAGIALQNQCYLESFMPPNQSANGCRLHGAGKGVCAILSKGRQLSCLQTTLQQAEEGYSSL